MNALTDNTQVHDKVENRVNMATTVEAVFAAVQMDGAGQDQFHRVMARFGLQHKLLEPIQRAWIYQAVKSRMELPDRFFIGHHFKLQEGIFATQLKRFIIQEKEIGLRKRLDWLWKPANLLWKRVEGLWLGHPRRTRTKYGRLRRKQLPVSTPATQEPTEGFKPLVEGPRPTATGTTITPSKNVATAETEMPDEDSPGRSKDERNVASDQTTEREAWAKKQEPVAESDTDKPTPSKRTKRQLRSSPSKDTTGDDVATTEAGLQDPNKASYKASTDGLAPDLSGKYGAVADAELDVEHQLDEAFEAELIEAIEGESRKKMNLMKEKTKQMDAQFRMRQVEMENEFRQLRLARGTKTVDQKREFNELLEDRQRLKEHLQSINNKLSSLG